MGGDTMEGNRVLIMASFGFLCGIWMHTLKEDDGVGYGIYLLIFCFIDYTPPPYLELFLISAGSARSLAFLLEEGKTTHMDQLLCPDSVSSSVSRPRATCMYHACLIHIEAHLETQ